MVGSSAAEGMVMKMKRWRTVVVSRWLAMEPVQLGIAALAIALLQFCMARLTPALAGAQTYVDEHVNFTSFGAFSKLCNSVTTCMVAGVLTLVHGKKRFKAKAPIYAYAAIAVAAAIAVVAENQLEGGLGKERDLSWQCLIVFVVMALQIVMIRREFSKQDWLASTLFVCGCFFSALPWLSTQMAAGPAPWYLVLGGTVVAFLYLGMEGLNQTYQDKLFCDLGTAITEQVLFISLFASLIRLIGFLWEFRVVGALMFFAKHPLSFASVVLLSCMGAAMAFLMSYMLRLCGALICVMIHQIMVNSMAGKGQEFKVVDYALKWGGILLMSGMLALTMLKMQHGGGSGGHKDDADGGVQFTLTDVDLEELDDGPLLPSPPPQASHVHQSDPAAGI